MKLILFLTVVIALSSSILTLVLHYFPRILKFSFFALLGISGLGAIWAGLSVLITQQNINYQIISSFPSLVFQFTLDPLAGFFLAIVGLIVVCVAFYGPGYMREFEKQRSITLMSFFTGLFISSMYLVLIAHDVFSFMLSWELMSVSSYFLVAYHHEQATNRQAALIYLLMSQTSGLLILFAFSILIKFAGNINFDILHAVKISPMWESCVFLLAFFGFGMKAGIVPLHVWLPQAHPAAPSHISALMSGVMLKVAIYGFIRLVFGLLNNIYWQWGSVVLFFGVASAIIGVLYALMQHDLKKLLAYHSVENIGIIFIGLGLSLIFMGAGYPVLAALGLIAALYHCLNHAIFKSLLFLGAGTILQYTHEHDLERMGGLIKKMPYTAWCFLIGCISISALPPFNGFVSEWLIFQDAFQAPVLKSEIMRTLIPVSAALLALTSALAAACFIKVYGIVFLGQARTLHINSDACNPKCGMKIAMGFLALLCLFFGILPAITISLLNVISKQLINMQLPNTQSLLWLVPITTKTSSYSAILITTGILLTILISYLIIRAYFGKIKLRAVKPWDCGYGGINARMQYSATAFAMPLRRIFQAAWLINEKIERNALCSYSLQISDRIWNYIYLPLERFSSVLSKKFSRLQGGNIRIYLAYTLITLIILLWAL